MAAKSQDELFEVAINVIEAAVKLPVVRVDREAFLSKLFAESPYLDVILEQGPQVVYTPDSLRKKASEVIKASTRMTATVAFVAGLPANLLIAIPAGAVDVAQYFAFSLMLAQQLAYLFGEQRLFDNENGASELNEEAIERIIAYLGVMMGVSGAQSLIAKGAVQFGEVAGKRIAAMPLTKTIWYPLLKKVAAALGAKMNKQIVGKTVTKVVPVLGGAVSAGLSYATFRPMGERLADTFVRNLKGEFDAEELELNPEFAARCGARVPVSADVVEVIAE